MKLIISYKGNDKGTETMLQGIKICLDKGINPDMGIHSIKNVEIK